MRHTTHVLLATVLCAALAPHSAFAAQGHGRGHANGRGVRSADESVVIDRDGERRIVRDYYRNNGLPPGLAKRDSLPPGLAKQLRERGELPPGLQKRLTTVPSPLSARLPRLPGYFDRYFAGNDLVVVDRRSNRIVWLIPNVF
jgi:hypothetical protein